MQLARFACESLIQAPNMEEHFDESSQTGTEIKTALIYKQDQVSNDLQCQRVHVHVAGLMEICHSFIFIFSSTSGYCKIK